MIGVVDYGVCNLGSVRNMLHRIGAEAFVSSDAKELAQATKLILPGVGSFDQGMHNLAQLGLFDALNNLVLNEHVPVLGICLGMQLLTQRSEEGTLPGFGWIDAETVRFTESDVASSMRIPHMGWNTLQPRREHTVLKDLTVGSRFYFVHSYYVRCRDAGDIVATTSHLQEFTSVVAKGRILGTQFHPEKRHRFGMALLRNFAFEVEP
jgi:imidazole glycerol-phosphate synthase subunit HisH